MNASTIGTCECRKPATFLVKVYDDKTADLHTVADHHWATCDEHLTRDVRRCAAQSPTARPLVVLSSDRELGIGDRDV